VFQTLCADAEGNSFRYLLLLLELLRSHCEGKLGGDAAVVWNPDRELDAPAIDGSA